MSTFIASRYCQQIPNMNDQLPLPCSQLEEASWGLSGWQTLSYFLHHAPTQSRQDPIIAQGGLSLLNYRWLIRLSLTLKWGEGVLGRWWEVLDWKVIQSQAMVGSKSKAKHLREGEGKEGRRETGERKREQERCLTETGEKEGSRVWSRLQTWALKSHFRLHFQSAHIMLCFLSLGVFEISSYAYSPSFFNLVWVSFFSGNQHFSLVEDTVISTLGRISFSA